MTLSLGDENIMSQLKPPVDRVDCNDLSKQIKIIKILSFPAEVAKWVYVKGWWGGYWGYNGTVSPWVD